MSRSKPKKLSLRDARTSEQICSLQRDNFESNGYWMLKDIHTGEVTICKQEIGQAHTEIISIPIKTFHYFIDAYCREQVCRKDASS